MYDKKTKYDNNHTDHICMVVLSFPGVKYNTSLQEKTASARNKLYFQNSSSITLRKTTLDTNCKAICQYAKVCKIINTFNHQTTDQVDIHLDAYQMSIFHSIKDLYYISAPVCSLLSSRERC